MFRKLLLFAIITALGSLPTKAQSDDGWFTGRLLLCANGGDDGSRAQVYYAHYYNFNNYFSAGLGEGIFVTKNPLMPLTANVRVRPFGHRRWMPVFCTSGGYAVPLGGGEGRKILTPRIGLEGGKLVRFRFVIDAGCQILGDSCGWIVGAGLMF